MQHWKSLAERGDGYEDLETEKKEKIRGWTLGIVLIVLTAFIWSASSVLVQYIYTDLRFNQPFGLTIIGSSLFSVLIPGHLGLSALGLLQSSSRGILSGELAMPLVSVGRGETELDHNGVVTERQLGTLNGVTAEAESLLGRRTQPSEGVCRPVNSACHVFAAKVGFGLCPLWFFGQLSYNFSLLRTSVTSSTIISQLSSLFAFTFSVMLGFERFTAVKVCGLILSLLGAVAVGLGDKGDQDGGDTQETLWGDVAATGSAVLFGVYATALRLWVPFDEEAVIPLILGYMGVFNVLLFTPILVVLILIPGIQPLAGLSLTVLGLVVGKGMFENVLSELLWARAVVLTTPTVATVGLSLTVPIAFITDLFLHGVIPSPLALCGATLVVGGFMVVARNGDAEIQCQDDADNGSP